jgi:hypothetical protein
VRIVSTSKPKVFTTCILREIRFGVQPSPSPQRSPREDSLCPADIDDGCLGQPYHITSTFSCSVNGVTTNASSCSTPDGLASASGSLSFTFAGFGTQELDGKVFTSANSFSSKLNNDLATIAVSETLLIEVYTDGPIRPGYLKGLAGGDVGYDISGGASTSVDIGPGLVGNFCNHDSGCAGGFGYVPILLGTPFTITLTATSFAGAGSAQGSSRAGSDITFQLMAYDQFCGPNSCSPNNHVVIQGVPEPSTWPLSLVGLGTLGAFGARSLKNRRSGEASGRPISE